MLYCCNVNYNLVKSQILKLISLTYHLCKRFANKMSEKSTNFIWPLLHLKYEPGVSPGTISSWGFTELKCSSIVCLCTTMAATVRWWDGNGRDCHYVVVSVVEKLRQSWFGVRVIRKHIYPLHWMWLIDLAMMTTMLGVGPLLFLVGWFLKSSLSAMFRISSGVVCGVRVDCMSSQQQCGAAGTSEHRTTNT